MGTHGSGEIIGCWKRRHPPGEAVEQWPAESTLQGADMGRYGGLAQTERLGGLVDCSCPVNGQKGAEQLQIGQAITSGDIRILIPKHENCLLSRYHRLPHSVPRENGTKERAHRGGRRRESDYGSTPSQTRHDVASDPR